MDILPKKKKESATDPYTTANTMAALEFDANDVCEELKAITVNDYAETMFDDRNAAAPPFSASCFITRAKFAIGD